MNVHVDTPFLCANDSDVSAPALPFGFTLGFLELPFGFALGFLDDRLMDGWQYMGKQHLDPA